MPISKSGKIGGARDRQVRRRLCILFLTQVFPYPLDAGPKIRAYYVLRHLGARLIKQKTSEILK